MKPLIHFVFVRKKITAQSSKNKISYCSAYYTMIVKLAVKLFFYLAKYIIIIVLYIKICSMLESLISIRYNNVDEAINIIRVVFIGLTILFKYFYVQKCWYFSCFVNIFNFFLFIFFIAFVFLNPLIFYVLENLTLTIFESLQVCIGFITYGE